MKSWSLLVLSLLVPATAFPQAGSRPQAVTGVVKMDETSKQLELTDKDISVYLAGYPKMTAFMAARGGELEKAQSDPVKAGAAQAGMEAEFEKLVGIPFPHFFEIHSAVSAAFAEALAERSREQQKKSMSDSIAELKKQIAAKETPADTRQQLEQQLSEMELGLKELQTPVPPEPNLSRATRKAVRARLDEIEKVYTEQNVPGAEGPVTPPHEDAEEK